MASDSKARVTAVIAIVLSLVNIGLTYWQAHTSSDQLKETRREFEESGAILNVVSALQVGFSDGRKGPENAEDSQKPAVTNRDFDTFDSINLVLTLTNTGRQDSSIIEVRLHVAPGLDVVGRRGQKEQYPVRCSISGGTAIDCSDALPYTLKGGTAYYVYFSLKELRGIFHAPFVGQGLDVEIIASAIPEGRKSFKSGVSVAL